MTKRTFLKKGNSWVHWVSFALVACAVTSFAGIGHAQQNVPTDTSFNIQLFKPSPGPLNFFSIESPELGADMKPFVGAMLMYERRPFTIYNCNENNECNDEQEATDASGHPIGAIHAIDNLLTLDLLGGFNFLEYFSAGLALPITVFQNGQGFSPMYDNVTGNNWLAPGDDYSTVFSPGDLRIHVKGRFLGDDREDGISLGVSANLTLPIWEWIGYGREESDTNNYGYGGDAFLSGTFPRLLLGYRIGKFRTAINAGAYWRKKVKILNAEVGHLIEFGAAVGYAVIPEIELIAEIFGNKTLNSANFTDTESSSLSFLAGAQFRLSDFTIHAAGGGGILSGLGVPQFEFLVGVGWAPQKAKAKEFVGNEADIDMDGIDNARDKCPEEPEDLDEFEDADGCPEFDNDKDGILDGYDSCVNDAEDKDGFRDDDGCPELDNDGDGVPDANDECPDKAETLNGIKDDDGCPDKGKTLVVITDNQIELKEMIQFKKNSDVIRGDKSFQILDIVTSILKANRKVRVSIEGHTDNRGAAAYNRELSKKRADAVKRYLVGKGVATDRLETAGWGPDKPIESNKTVAGRAANRRVEFNIIPSEDAVPAPAATEPEPEADEGAAAGEGGDDSGGAMDFTSE